MPAPRYHLLTDYGERALDPGQSADAAAPPAALLMFERLAYPQSFSPRGMASVLNVPTDGVKERADPLFQTRIRSLTVSRPKGQYLKTMQVALPSDRDWQFEVLPGDWVVAWIMPRWRLADLVARARKGEACNGWLDGLRFVGTVEDGPREALSGDSYSYNFSAVQFGELASSVFYDPHLAENHTTMGSWLAKLEIPIQQLLYNPTDDPTATATIHGERAIRYFFDTLVGQGVPKRLADPGNDPAVRIATGAGAGVIGEDPGGEAPFAYLVPERIGSILGRKSRSKRGGALAFADLCDLLTGVQKYAGQAGADARARPWALFQPDGSESSAQSGLRHRQTGRPLVGHFIPTPPAFSSRSLWEIVMEFLNPACNEAYTALRAAPDGSVVPTLVVRQIPFTSDDYAEVVDKNGSGVTRVGGPGVRVVTAFSELPRWVMHPALRRGQDLGPSNSARLNMVHCYGQAATMQSRNSLTFQIVRNPPIRDDADICRSGLRPWFQTVACSLEDTVGGPRAWMELIADRGIGMHLVHSGTLSSAGPYAPVSEGDNLESEDGLYHIEGLTLTYQEDDGGSSPEYNATWMLSFGHHILPDGRIEKFGLTRRAPRSVPMGIADGNPDTEAVANGQTRGDFTGSSLPAGIDGPGKLV